MRGIKQKTHLFQACEVNNGDQSGKSENSARVACRRHCALERNDDVEAVYLRREVFNRCFALTSDSHFRYGRNHSTARRRKFSSAFLRVENRGYLLLKLRWEAPIFYMRPIIVR